MQPDNTRNFIIAIVLSIAVLIGWQYFFAQPQTDQARQEVAEQQAAQPGAAIEAAPGVAPAPGAAPSAAPGTPTYLDTREAALATSPRVPVDTPSVTGSINLRGARLDDLRLDGYRVTTDDNSPTVVLLSPAQGPSGYFAEFGWIAGAGGPALPGPDTEWTAADGATLTAETPVVLTWDNRAGLTFERTIAVDSEYLFTVTDTIANAGATAVSLTPYARVQRLGEPESSRLFFLPEGFISALEGKNVGHTWYNTIVDDGPQTLDPATGGWLGFTDKYWATALVPAPGESFTGRFSYSDPGGRRAYQADYRKEPITIEPGATAGTEARLFAGAKEYYVIEGYETAPGIPRLGMLIDWGWFYFITEPMFIALDWFYRILGNLGLAILAVTVVVKGIFFPLANRSYVSMSAMKKVQPQMTALRERFKDDPAKQQQALMELYKKEKINPLAGCWPILIQIPVFFALYTVLYITIEMRHAPFFGWIQDLSARDPTSVFNLFGLIPWTPPDFLWLGVWPIVMGITMWVQMRLNPTPPEPAQRIIFNWMPVIFTFMLAAFPAGLVIYWAWNNLLSILQQYVIMRRQGVEVNLFGNILSSFRRKPADKPDAAKS